MSACHFDIDCHRLVNGQHLTRRGNNLQLGQLFIQPKTEKKGQISTYKTSILTNIFLDILQFLGQIFPFFSWKTAEIVRSKILTW